jgi:HSP20 family protein
MLVTRYNPYAKVGMRRSLDVVNQLLNHLDEVQEEGIVSSFVPVVNTREGEFAYHVELDLPGIKKEDIEITTEDNVLTISGERKLKEEAKEEDYYKVESLYGKFSRSFTLPEKIDVENIHAESSDGVLEVIIPKLKEEDTKPKKIEIK